MRPGTAVNTEDLEVDLLLEAIYGRYHYDFRGYARTSIKRRVLLARDRVGCRSLSELQERVLHEPGVFQHVLDYLTVQVSDLFRDPSFFKTLRHDVVPYLRTYPSLKVWVAGCSTGEELYALAILFREEGLEDRTVFYATDISPDALSKAEAGVYDADRLPLFTTNHRQSGASCSLSDYYTAAYGRAVFDRSLRRRTVFSDHSLVSDAVFAEMQLILCRNVLMYFERALQNRAVGLFKESLVHGGFLGLGAKESLLLNGHREAFTEFRADQRLYQRNRGSDRPQTTGAEARSGKPAARLKPVR